MASARLFVAVALVTGSAAIAACAQHVVVDEGPGHLMAGKTIEAVLKQHTDRLLSLPGVVGTAIGECEGNPCIKVLVVKESPEVVKNIPPALEGFPVVIEESGEIRALGAD